MEEKLYVELQDDEGNVYYLHTSSSTVFCEDGKSVQEKIGTVKGRITTKENLKLVTEANYLPEAKAVKEYFDELTGKLVSGYTHLTSNKAGYVNLPNGLKMVFGMYPASSMTHNGGSGTYVATLSLTEYGLKDPVWGTVGVKYPSGLPQAHILDLTTSRIQIGCSHDANNIYIMWIVIG